MHAIRRSIYCTGPHGKVGWVSTWEYDQTDRTRIRKIYLTLDHQRAHKFDLGYTEPRVELQRLCTYLAGNTETYGTYGVFEWGYSK